MQRRYDGPMGYGDMAMARWAPYNLTTIHQPIDDIVWRSVELILEVVEGVRTRPNATLFPCSVIVRATLRLPPTRGPRARREAPARPA